MRVKKETELIVLADRARWIQLVKSQYLQARLRLDWWYLKNGWGKRPLNKAQTKLGQTSLPSFYLYLRNNLDSIVNYQTYRRKGYFIGSV